MTPEDAALARKQKGPKPSLWLPTELDRFSMDELIQPPAPMQFVVAPYLPMGCAAVLTGAGGSSKTGTATASFAIPVCAGLEVFGERVDMGRVLIISAEDRRAILHRHVWANTRDLNDTQRKRISENLIVKDAVGTGFKLTRHIDGQTDTAIEVGQLIEFASEIEGLQLIVFDTLSRLNGGEETNEDLARFIEAMERVSVETGAATLALHHSGKAQMRSDTNDQYSGRGGSSLSDNARSVMHLAKITADTAGAPTNASELIGEGRLIRLSHVKSNYAAQAADRYLERVVTPYAAHIREFKAEFGSNDAEGAWKRIAEWLAGQDEVPYPTRATIDSLPKRFGSRPDRRRAIGWALDRDQLREVPHPDPRAGRKVYLALPKASTVTTADDYRSAADGR